MILPRVSANLLVRPDRNAGRRLPTTAKPTFRCIADELHMEVDELFPVAEALQMLRFAEIEGGDIKLTDAGKQFAEAGMDDRKKLFQRQLLAYVPLAAHIRRVLQERANHVRAEEPLPRRTRGSHDARKTPKQTLRSVTAWGRFAESLRLRRSNSQTFSLENPT